MAKNATRFSIQPNICKAEYNRLKFNDCLLNNAILQ